MKCAGWMLVITLAFIPAGCGSGPAASNPTAAPLPRPSPAPATSPISAAPARNGETLDILSVLSVEHELDVLAQREGVVVETSKDEGARVQAGEALARLDDRTIQQELEKARADLQVAQNNVLYKEAEAKARNANLRRQQELRKYGLSSEADLSQAEFEAKATAYEVESWGSMVKSSEAAIRELQLELDKTRIRAPFSGVVVRRFVRQGQEVTKDEKCFRISQLGPLEVQFQVPETSAVRPKFGARLRIALASELSETFSARVVRLTPTVDPASDSYDVTARLTGANLAGLRPGMAVHVFWPAKNASKQ